MHYKQPLTATATDLGIWLNVKLVLYLQNQCLAESLAFLNPRHRQKA
jgi:hypothetical protein